ncbi:ROK family transcriptional regulator [Paenibacillus sp.]|uniref:ROK family transcriptional regulator n=1 Tax=Paenibacillus sp. TaxID=58172 RepID=UPI002810AE47|nr:ROK family transcriptional regulator [Paenibacillus sp.]
MHSQKNTSHKLLKSINQQKVLQLIYTSGSISRVELAQRTGLSQQTVTNIVNRLLEEGVVYEGEHLPLEAGSGRKRIQLSVNSSNFYVIGIELAGKYIRGSMCNFRPEVLYSAERRTEKYRNSEHLLQLLIEVIEELLRQAPDVTHTRGIGISVQGLADSREGVLLRTPGIGFERIPVKVALEKKFDMPVYLENDANLLALNENMNGSLSDSAENITLKFDYGIGGAIVSEKRLISGSTFVAGEFGHVKAFVGKDAHLCLCGGVGCLTTLLSISGLGVTTGYTLDSFARAYHNGDEEVVRMYGAMVDALAMTLSNAVTFLNPDRVLLTGRVLTAVRQDILSILTEKVQSNIPLTSRGVKLIHLERMPDETLLAARLVLKHVFEVPLEALGI